MSDSIADKSKDVKKSTEDQPSTSSEPVKKEEEAQQNKEEMDRLLQATNEMLETKAKSMNLSSLNVRSILHHLIKYPSTIDVLLGIRETDDLPTVRNTRSRKRPGDSAPTSATQTPKKFALRIEDKGPKNFLDLEYQEDDEYDDDYVEENEKSPREDAETGDSEDDEENEDEEMEGEEEEENDEEIEEELQEISDNLVIVEEQEKESTSNRPNDSFEALLLNNDTNEFQHDEKLSNLSMTLNETMPRSESAAPVPTLDNVVDDDDYRDFVISLQRPNEELMEQAQYDTDDDEDYNVIADNLVIEDWDETRQDKTTMIPRHEVKALMMDTLLAEKEIPINVFPEEAIVLEDEEYMRIQRKRHEETISRQNFSEFDSESCSLLQDRPVVFRPQEIQQLRMQLEQHVQLLTQFVITCHHAPDVAIVRNHAQLMLNEMDDLRLSNVEDSLFNVSNLPAAIESCHDINGFATVDEEHVRWDQVGDGHLGTVLRPEAAAVLSRSRAIRYPDLLIPFQPALIPTQIAFLPSENLMLAVGLLQFAHLPRRAEKGLMDRYTAIHKNCLPARDAYKIRSHLKTMRRPSNNPSPIHLIVQAAEKGICNLTIPEKQWNVTDLPISMWPISMQPKWYQLFVSRFNVTENREIHRRNEKKFVLTPVKMRRKKEEEMAVRNGFVTVGEGPGGQEVVMDKQDLQELVIRLIKENEISPSKRRKNSTPMKLSSIPILAEVSHIVEEQEALEASEKATSSDITSDETLNLLNSDSQNSEPPEGSRSVSAASSTADSDSDESSFLNPPTPGRRPPDEHDYLDDLESNSLTWFKTPNSVTMGNPRTPRGFIMNSETAVDFSAMLTSSDTDTDDCFSACQAPMGMAGRSEVVTDFSYSPRHSSESTSSTAPPCETPSEIMEEDSMTGLDLVPSDEEDDVASEEQQGDEEQYSGGRKRSRSSGSGDVKASRKRTRAQREEMGAVGLADEDFHGQQKAAIVKRVIEDVEKRLFMHTETWQRLVKTLAEEKMSEQEKIHETVHLLSAHPHLLSLVLLYAPSELIPAEFQANPLFESHKIAVEMILDVERYVAGAKIKEPTIRNIFRYIRSFVETDSEMKSEHAARKFFQLLGQDRPLWKRLEPHFHCLPYKSRPENVEKYEFIDLSRPEPVYSKREKREKIIIPAQFEVIDDIDQVCSAPYRYSRYEEKSNLVVKFGEFCVRNPLQDTYTQLVIRERQWARKDDIILLTRYNEAVKANPDFDDEDTPQLVPELNFGAKSVVARLKYLLAELKTT